MQDQPKNPPPQPLGDRTAADVMERAVVQVHVDDLLTDVERTMSDAHVSGAPVIDNRGRVLGVISLRDLVRRRADDQELPNDVEPRRFDGPAHARAGDVMTQDLIAVPPNMPLPAVARRMADARVHRVLVGDQDRLLGLVSSMDLIGAMAGIV